MVRRWGAVSRNQTAVVFTPLPSRREVSVAPASSILHRAGGFRFLCSRRAGARIAGPPRGRSARPGARLSPALTAASPAARSREDEPCRSCRRQEPCVLPPYVHRLGNSSLDTAVTDTATRPLPLSRGSEWATLGLEADPGATCCPTLLGDAGVKDKVALPVFSEPLVGVSGAARHSGNLS